MFDCVLVGLGRTVDGAEDALDLAISIEVGQGFEAKQVEEVLRGSPVSALSGLPIPLGGVGTVEAIRAIASDAQLANRFEPLVLHRWEFDREFLVLLASFERLLPLRRASQLTADAVAAKLLAMSEGTIGELHSVLASAAEYAILGGHEKTRENRPRGPP